MSLILLSSLENTQFFFRKIASILFLKTSPQILVLLLKFLALCNVMMNTLFTLSSAGSWQSTEVSEMYLIYMHIFLRQVQCIKSITSFFSYFNKIFSQLQNDCT